MPSVPPVPGTVTSELLARVQSRTQGTYAGVYDTSDAVIAPLSMTVTAQKPGGVLEIVWELMGESSAPENQGFVVTKGGVLMPDSVDGSDNPWSALACCTYDTTDNDTPEVLTVRIFDESPTVGSAVTYSVCARTTRASTTSTFYLNRSVGSTGASTYETGLSSGSIKEYS